MKSLFKTTIGAITAVLMVFTPLVTVSAQPAETDSVFTSQLTGDDVVLGASSGLIFSLDDYDFIVNDPYQEEFIWVWSEYSSFELILVDGPTTAEEYMDSTLSNMVAFYDSWEMLDQVTGDDTAWFVGEGEIDGSMLLVYFEYEVDVFGDIDFAYMQFSTDIDLFPDMDLAQREMTVGGLSVPLSPDKPAISDATGMPFEDQEATPTEAAVTETTSRTSRTSRTATTPSETTETETTGTESETPSRTSRTSRSSSNTEVPSTESRDTNLSETSGTLPGTTGTSRTSRTTIATATAEADELGGWGAYGLGEDGSWVSPTFGATVEWDTTLWEFPLDYDSAIIVSDEGWDSLTLQTADGLGYVFITVQDAGDSTPRSTLAYWQSDEYLSTVGPDPVVLESASTRDSASIIYSTFNRADEEIVVILDASFQDDGTVVYTQLTAAPETIAEVYANYVDGVTLDGGSLNLTWDVEDVQDMQP